MMDSGPTRGALPDPIPRKLKEPIVWSAVNFSEGRRPEVIGAILSAAGARVTLADWSADYDHNRMVATLLGDAESVFGGILAACEEAVERIDMRSHSGAHPRAGAVDVIPLVPVRGVTMAECVGLSLRLGEEIGRRLGVPVFLYEESARAGRRMSLPEIRKGGFEGLFLAALTGDRQPDYGPAAPHPTAGAVVVGARNPLTAYNVNLNTEDVSVARKIAADIRRERVRNPAVAGVRALGLSLESRRMTQVSMNLTVPAASPVPGVFGFVRERADNLGAAAAESEIIGLISRAALGGASPEEVLWRGFHERQILENWAGGEP